MKNKTIFWGLFLILLGILLLFKSMGLLTGDMDYIFRLWPLFIIIWGLSLLKLPDFTKKIFAGVSAILLALFVTAFFSHSFWNWKTWNFNFDNEDSNTEYYSNDKKLALSHPFDSTVKNMTFHIKGGAGSFQLQDTCPNLVELYTDGDVKNLDFRLDDKAKYMSVDLGKLFGKNIFRPHRHSRSAEIKINGNPVWDLNFDIGASELDCDLSNYKINNVNLKAGAANIQMKLGDRNDLSVVHVDVGASNVEISVPASSGCEINSSTGLSSDNFEGFIRNGNYYKTENFDTAKKKLTIVISGGISNFEVTRY